MDIDSRVEDGMLVLTVRSPRLDAARAVTFKECVHSLLRADAERVVIDMAEVDFLDSSGLGALVAVMKMLGGGRRLELANCGAIVRKVLMLTRMDGVFVLHDTLPPGPHRGRTAA
ncbi:STAS domain-containing protein [Jannaschia rubra]|uniref:Putative anti-sigma factor antagonist n=1 Tax=Jannaschia rubra TaxID=282197 RepID=A0A0M6XTG2_9RHOB|nr:STAS domain-containing protein [Jannaschia rubra]CTQ33475.1 Putative anti-sigma factor antagonist [Jannaschia rubra]SFG02433.1 anti-sigma B factor antagonist [Jannaschia rubra]